MKARETASVQQQQILQGLLWTSSRTVHWHGTITDLHLSEEGAGFELNCDRTVDTDDQATLHNSQLATGFTPVGNNIARCTGVRVQPQADVDDDAVVTVAEKGHVVDRSLKAVELRRPKTLIQHQDDQQALVVLNLKWDCTLS
eukprot:SAG11_NODE_1642_length_4529_cov_2.274944_5_plen_143_part_00